MQNLEEESGKTYVYALKEFEEKTKQTDELLEKVKELQRRIEALKEKRWQALQKGKTTNKEIENLKTIKNARANIETFEGGWPEKQPEARENVKMTSTNAREPLHFEKLVMRRLDAPRIARGWIQAIWDFTRENKLVDYDLPLDTASNEDMERALKLDLNIKMNKFNTEGVSGACYCDY